MRPEIDSQLSSLVAGRDPLGSDAQIARYAQSQHGLVTFAQLLEIGVARATISHRAHDGRLHRIHRGVYAVGHSVLSQEARWMAAVLAAGDGAVLSHSAAAILWGFLDSRDARIDITARARHRRICGVHSHSSRTLHRRDFTIRWWIPVTSVARTQLDLGDIMTAHELAHVLDQASYRNKVSIRSIRDTIERNRGRRAATVLNEALELYIDGSVGVRSELESRYLAHLR